MYGPMSSDSPSLYNFSADRGAVLYDGFRNEFVCYQNNNDIISYSDNSYSALRC